MTPSQLIARLLIAEAAIYIRPTFGFTFRNMSSGLLQKRRLKPDLTTTTTSTLQGRKRPRPLGRWRSLRSVEPSWTNSSPQRVRASERPNTVRTDGRSELRCEVVLKEGASCDGDTGHPGVLPSANNNNNHNHNHNHNPAATTTRSHMSLARRGGP